MEQAPLVCKNRQFLTAKHITSASSRRQKAARLMLVVSGIKMEEKALPQELLSRASVSPGGEQAWKMEDTPKVIEAAKAVGLANLGGQPQFQGPIGTAEPY